MPDQPPRDTSPRSGAPNAIVRDFPGSAPVLLAPATPNAAPLHCEVFATQRETSATLAAIARTCAQDIGVRLEVTGRALRGRRGQPSSITLHLPVEFAASQHPAWCLACRIACFCPDARVSVLVGAGDFAAPVGKPRRTA